MEEVAVSLPMYVSFLDYPTPVDHAICVNFVGCDHACKGCHNPTLQFRETAENYKYYDSPERLLADIQNFAIRNRTNKVVLSGGDPLHPSNVEFVKAFLELESEFDVMVYTGYDIKYVKEHEIKAKFIKCGKYIEGQAQASQKTGSKFVLASKNQVLYDSEYKPLSNNGEYNF